MSNNREERIYQNTVHLFLAIQRTGTSKDKKCIRTVIKHNEEEDLKVFEAKLKAIGGEWRIHKTVNSRDVKKAYKIFMKRMIDFPEKASIIDSEWKTALLQKECKATNLFMFDVDTKETEKLRKFENILKQYQDLAYNVSAYKSSKGFHYITLPFDTREIYKLDYVTLLRDGYYYIKTVNGE